MESLTEPPQKNYTTISEQTGAAYTFVFSDANTEVEGNSATAQVFTIPTNADVPYPVGTVINARQIGTGQIEVVGDVGVTIRSPNGTKTAEQWATISIIKRDTDEWVVSGDSIT